MTGNVRPFRIKINLNRVRASSRGRVIAETTHGLILMDGDHAPIHFFPAEDVDMACLAPTDRRTRSPRLGEAAYFALNIDGEVVENAAWSLQATPPETLALKHYIAFRGEKVSVSEVSRGQEAWTPPTNPQGAYPAS